MHLWPLTDIPILVSAMVANDPVEFISDNDHLTDDVNDETFDPGFDSFNLSDDNKIEFNSHEKHTHFA